MATRKYDPERRRAYMKMWWAKRREADGTAARLREKKAAREAHIRTCRTCDAPKALSEFQKHKLKSGRVGHSWQCRKCSYAVRDRRYKADPAYRVHMSEIQKRSARRLRRTVLGWAKAAIWSLKSRAERKGIPFSLAAGDLVAMFPQSGRCPALGVELCLGRRSDPNAASVDRIVPRLGYVKGNVVVISRRANSIKNDATAGELRQIAEWLDRHSLHAALVA